MIKLKGKIEGVEVAFDFIPPNKFRGTLPKEFDGVYTIELNAEDEAGNESSYADMIVTIDFEKLDFRIRDKKTHFKSSSEKFSHRIIDEKYRTEIIERRVNSED